MNAVTILCKTDTGLRVLKDRSVPLAPRLRSAFILFDGKRTLAEVLRATVGMGVVEDDVTAMVDSGLLEPRKAQQMSPEALAKAAQATAAARAEVAEAAALAGRSEEEQVVAALTGRTPQERYTAAYPIATALTAGMGLFGFRLNLAVERASGYEALCALAPRIRDAVGLEKYARLDRALYG